MGYLECFNYKTLDAETRIVVQQRTSEISSLMKRTAESIIEIGEKLADVKSRLEHGQFCHWLDSEFSWTVRTAQRYIQAAEVFGGKNDNLSLLAPSALYALAAPSTPEEAREEALEAASQGEKITHKRAKEIVDRHREPTPKPEPVEFGDGVAAGKGERAEVWEIERVVQSLARQEYRERTEAMAALRAGWPDQETVAKALEGKGVKINDLKQARNNVAEQIRQDKEWGRAPEPEPLYKRTPWDAGKLGLTLEQLEAAMTNLTNYDSSKRVGKPVSINGRLFIGTGGVHGGGQDIFELRPLLTPEEWEAQGEAPDHKYYVGDRVKIKGDRSGKEYVIGLNREAIRVRVARAAPEPEPEPEHPWAHIPKEDLIAELDRLKNLYEKADAERRGLIKDNALFRSEANRLANELNASTGGVPDKHEVDDLKDAILDWVIGAFVSHDAQARALETMIDETDYGKDQRKHLFKALGEKPSEDLLQAALREAVYILSCNELKVVREQATTMSEKIDALETTIDNLQLQLRDAKQELENSPLHPRGEKLQSDIVVFPKFTGNPAVHHNSPGPTDPDHPKANRVDYYLGQLDGATKALSGMSPGELVMLCYSPAERARAQHRRLEMFVTASESLRAALIAYTNTHAEQEQLPF